MLLVFHAEELELNPVRSKGIEDEADEIGEELLLFPLVPFVEAAQEGGVPWMAVGGADNVASGRGKVAGPLEVSTGELVADRGPGLFSGHQVLDVQGGTFESSKQKGSDLVLASMGLH